MFVVLTAPHKALLSVKHEIWSLSTRGSIFSMNFANKNGFSAASTNEGVSAANADWLLFLFFGIPRLMGYYFQDCQQETL